MADSSPRLTDREKDRILKHYTEGLTFAIIAQRMGRPARTVSRVIKDALAAKKQQPV